MDKELERFGFGLFCFFIQLWLIFVPQLRTMEVCRVFTESLAIVGCVPPLLLANLFRKNKTVGNEWVSYES